MSEIAPRARNIVRILCRRFPSRSGLHPATLAAAAKFIESEFRGIGYSPDLQEYQTPSGTARNVVAFKHGTEPAWPSIILGAHYDTVVGTPGADDNASGIAGLLEVARILRDTSTRHSVHFVAFAQEEPPYFSTPCMGSRAYARMLRKTGRRVLLMFSLEMLGCAGPDFSQEYPFPFMRALGRYPLRGDFIGIVGNLRTMRWARIVKQAMRETCSIGVESLCAPGFLPPLFLSDHSSFWKEGYPAVMITDSAFLRNPHYHLPSDSDDTLNYEFLADVVRGVCGAAITLDRAERL